MDNSLVEYHLCVSDHENFQSLLSFIQSNPLTVYTNTGYEFTPVKGHHTHTCVIFSEKTSPAWKKQLDRHRTKLNFLKKDKLKHPDGLGWYFLPASSGNNLSYILKKETKSNDKPNVQYYPTPSDEIDAYIEQSHQNVATHRLSKNGYVESIIQYINAQHNVLPRFTTEEHVLRYYLEVVDKMPPRNIRDICLLVKYKMKNMTIEKYMSELRISSLTSEKLFLDKPGIYKNAGVSDNDEETWSSTDSDEE